LEVKQQALIAAVRLPDWGPEHWRYFIKCVFV